MTNRFLLLILNRAYCCYIEDWKVTINDDPILINTFVEEESIPQVSRRMDRR